MKSLKILIFLIFSVLLPCYSYAQKKCKAEVMGMVVDVECKADEVIAVQGHGKRFMSEMDSALQANKGRLYGKYRAKLKQNPTLRAKYNFVLEIQENGIVSSCKFEYKNRNKDLDSLAASLCDVYYSVNFHHKDGAGVSIYTHRLNLMPY